MRFLMKISLPLEPFNSYVKNGSAGAKMGQIMGELHPEAVYFAEMNGRRTGIMIINLNDTSQIPYFAEPWFLLFNAEVQFHPVMSPEDLGRAGLEELGKKWG
jgi:hypothetical protein